MLELEVDECEEILEEMEVDELMHERGLSEDEARQVLITKSLEVNSREQKEMVLCQ